MRPFIRRFISYSKVLPDTKAIWNSKLAGITLVVLNYDPLKGLAPLKCLKTTKMAVKSLCLGVRSRFKELHDPKSVMVLKISPRTHPTVKAQCFLCLKRFI
jgi:hypothetical protein